MKLKRIALVLVVVLLASCLFSVPALACEVTVTNRNVVYDGNSHCINVIVDGNYTIKYSKDGINGPYSNTNPSFSQVGYYQVWVWVIVPGGGCHNDKFCSGYVKITPATITVSANSDSITYGDEAPSYTYSCSGLVGTDSVSTVLSGTPSLSCDYDQFDPVGGYTIDVDDTLTTTNSNYTLNINDGTLTVNPKTITVSANDDSITYGDEAPSYTYSCSGLVGTDSVSTVLSGTPSLSCDYDQFDPVGGYTIDVDDTLTITNSNYTLNINDGTLTVNPKTITVSVNDDSITYGDEAPSYTYSCSGFVGSDSESTVLSGTPSLSCDYDQFDPVGGYTIGVDDTLTTTNSNYTLNINDGTLTVNQKTITVSANDDSITYGDEVPSYTYSCSGFVGSDSESTVLSGTPSLSCDYDQFDPVGDYTIEIDESTVTSENSNYSLNIIDGKLTVCKKVLTVSAQQELITYGDEAPEFYIPTYEGFVGTDNSDNSLSGSPTLSCVYQKGDGAGEYDITVDVGEMSSENYSLEEKSGKLLVGKKTLTVTADDKTVTYGGPVPQYTAHITGFVNGDDVTCLGGSCQFACCYCAVTPVGEYLITPSGLESDNYDFEYERGTLTVNQKMLNVTFDSNGGTVVNPQNVGYGDLVIEPADPTKAGHRFNGWYADNETFEIAWDFETDTMPLKNITLYAKWDINTFNVSFFRQDGITQIGQIQTIPWNTAANFLTAPEVNGHAFDKWILFGDNDAETDSLTNVKENIKAVASYVKNGYTVTFLEYSGKIIGTDGVLYGEAAEAPIVPARDGYTFTGWDKTFNYVTSNMTVTAQYEINTYTVKFVDFDGKELKSQAVNWSTAAIAPANPTRAGYTFTGWDKAFNSVTSDLTVTAQYKINTTTINDEGVPKTYDDSQAFPWWWIVVAAVLIGAIVWILLFQARKHKNTGDTV